MSIYNSKAPGTKVVLFVLLFGACDSGVAPPPAGRSVSVATNQSTSGPKNPVLHLSIDSPQQPETDAKIFDETVNFAPNFAINQSDAALSDLFDKAGNSNLCFPTVLAENLIYLFAYHQPKFAALKLSGLINNGQSVDLNAAVRQLSSLCHTDASNGTPFLAGLNCSLAAVSQSSYGPERTQLISPFHHDPTLPTATREVTIDDIRTALKNDTPVILKIG